MSAPGGASNATAASAASSSSSNATPQPMLVGQTGTGQTQFAQPPLKISGQEAARHMPTPHGLILNEYGAHMRDTANQLANTQSGIGSHPMLTGSHNNAGQPNPAIDSKGPLDPFGVLHLPPGANTITHHGNKRPRSEMGESGLDSDESSRIHPSGRAPPSTEADTGAAAAAAIDNVTVMKELVSAPGVSSALKGRVVDALMKAESDRRAANDEAARLAKSAREKEEAGQLQQYQEALKTAATAAQALGEEFYRSPEVSAQLQRIQQLYHSPNWKTSQSEAVVACSGLASRISEFRRIQSTAASTSMAPMGTGYSSGFSTPMDPQAKLQQFERMVRSNPNNAFVNGNGYSGFGSGGVPHGDSHPAAAAASSSSSAAQNQSFSKPNPQISSQYRQQYQLTSLGTQVEVEPLIRASAMLPSDLFHHDSRARNEYQIQYVNHILDAYQNLGTARTFVGDTKSLTPGARYLNWKPTGYGKKKATDTGY